MITAYVLVMIVFTAGGSVATTTANFTSEATCEAARDAYLKVPGPSSRPILNVRAYCYDTGAR